MFRLLSAKLAETETKSRWRLRDPARPVPPVEISFRGPAFNPGSAVSESHVSVLLGRNGEGKSRILAGIATTFQLMQDYCRGGTSRGFPLSRLEYYAHGRHHLVECEGSKIFVSVDGVEATLDKILLPKKVIGLSMTPFDKFPIGSARLGRDVPADGMPDVYTYLGMRERMGRISTAALLTRALDGMVSRIAHDDRGRLTRVFEMLGFLPSVDVVYRIHERGVLVTLAQDSNIGLLPVFRTPG